MYPRTNKKQQQGSCIADKGHDRISINFWCHRSLPVDLIDCRLKLLMQVVHLMVLITACLKVSIYMHLVCMIIGMRLVSINIVYHAYPLTARYWAPDHSNAEKATKVAIFTYLNNYHWPKSPQCLK